MSVYSPPPPIDAVMVARDLENKKKLSEMQQRMERMEHEMDRRSVDNADALRRARQEARDQEERQRAEHEHTMALFKESNRQVASEANRVLVDVRKSTALAEQRNSAALDAFRASIFEVAQAIIASRTQIIVDPSAFTDHRPTATAASRTPTDQKSINFIAV